MREDVRFLTMCSMRIHFTLCTVFMAYYALPSHTVGKVKSGDYRDVPSVWASVTAGHYYRAMLMTSSSSRRNLTNGFTDWVIAI